MNIFYLDEDLEKCSQYHCDKHVIKMVTEYAQLLSSALHLNPNKKNGVGNAYRLTHKNHPSAVWTRESLDNWLWLRKLTETLSNEYSYRYEKTHKAGLLAKSLPIPSIEKLGITPFRCAMPEELITPNPIESYRSYYVKNKLNIISYRKRKVPNWLKLGIMFDN